MTSKLFIVFGLFLTIGIFAPIGMAQTTGFIFQGNLNSGGVVANGNHDFEFALFDAVSGGAQLGSTIAQNGVVLTNGVFVVSLDFGSQFPGAGRFLDIRIRPSGGGALTLLAPRQPVTSSPYSIKSLNADNATNALNATTATNATTAITATNATQLGGVAANQYLTTTNANAGYIQNTTSPQAPGNFNISGTGTANIFNATTQYNIGGSRVLSVAGISNAILGDSAGSSNSGGFNSFVGKFAGQNNTSGSLNSFFGAEAGRNNTTGGANQFFGNNAGNTNTTGGNNTVIGDNADVVSGNLTYATAIGAKALVSQSNSLVLGSINGVNGATADTNVGIGTTAPQKTLHVVGQDVRVEGSSTSVIPRFSIVNTAGIGTNTAKWQNYATYGALFGGLRFSALNDAENQESIWLNVVRNAGTAIRRVQFPSGNVEVANRLLVGTTDVDPISNLDVRGVVTVGLTAFPGAVVTQNSIFINNDGGQAANSFRLDAEGNTLYMTGRSDGGAQGAALAFKTGDAGTGESERVRIQPNGNVGIGTATTIYRLEVSDTSNAGLRVQTNTVGGTVASFGGSGAFRIDASGVPGGRFTVLENGNVGIGNPNPTDKLNVNGNISLFLASAGSTQVCQNASLQIANCSSSVRYKKDVNPFNQGLSLIKQLRPVSFAWKDGGMLDMGLVAEEVAAVEPLLTTTNAKGEIEGVKYDRVGVVLINAVKEQQVQIEAQQKQIEQQRKQIESLTKIVCAINSKADICRQ